MPSIAPLPSFPSRAPMRMPVRPSPGAVPASMLSEESKRMIAENLRGSDSGLYTIKGQNYLEGELHQDRITRHSRCEVFVEVASLLATPPWLTIA